jgi:hypothetical protein
MASYAGTLAFAVAISTIGVADTSDPAGTAGRLINAYRSCVNSGLQPNSPSFGPCILHMENSDAKRVPHA